MNPNQLRPWWLRKRVLFPLALVVGVVVAGAISFVDSNASTIMIYNKTGAALGSLKLTACGQETVLRGLAEDESFRWRLREKGNPSAIGVESAANPPWQWVGGHIEPRGGYRVTCRIWSNGEVENHTQISLWQRLFRGAPNINE